MIDRRTVVCVLALGILVAPVAAGAQQAGKIARVGVLADAPSPALEGFRQALNELGYIEGRNLVLVYRWAEGKLDRLPELEDELVRLRVDVILAPSSTFVRAAKQATTSLPIVFAVHNDPVGTGDVASLAHPGGNITGVTQMATDITAKQLQLLLEAVPGARRVAVLWNPTTPSNVPSLKEVREAAGRLGVVLQLLEARTAGEFDRGYAAAAREHAQAVLVLTSPASLAERRRVAELALRHRLPTMHGFREFAEAGGLMSYAANRTELFRRAAVLVDKILKGAKPADLPVEQPTRFELVINLKTAKALGLTIPQLLLLRADQVIQ